MTSTIAIHPDVRARLRRDDSRCRREPLARTARQVREAVLAEMPAELRPTHPFASLVVALKCLAGPLIIVAIGRLMWGI